MQFKLWLQKEGLSGPGGGATLDNPHADMRARAKDDAAKGVGALKTLGDDPPPLKSKSPTDDYLDTRARYMKKKMRKN